MISSFSAFIHDARFIIVEAVIKKLTFNILVLF